MTVGTVRKFNKAVRLIESGSGVGEALRETKLSPATYYYMKKQRSERMETPAWSSVNTTTPTTTTDDTTTDRVTVIVCTPGQVAEVIAGLR